jgi:beta-phosphoglucomutase
LQPDDSAIAVIFDFDGVIADSESQHCRAFQQVLATRGWTLTQADYYEKYLGYSDQELFESMAGSQGEALSAPELHSLIDEKGRAFADLMKSGAALCPGADNAIRRLVEVFPLGIASAAFSHEIAQVLEGAGLRSCFRTIVGADDVTASKPSPEPYLEAARRLGIAPTSCAAIEDSPWGLESARAAGLRTIGITHTYERARLTIADVVIDSLDEVTETFVRELMSRR